MLARLMIAALFALLSCTASAQFPSLTGTNGVYFWFNIVPDNANPASVANYGSHEYSFSHASIAPPGETRNLWIHRVTVQIQGVQQPDHGTASLILEAPSESSQWKILTYVTDGYNGGVSERSFNPPVPMTSADTLCLATQWLGYGAGGYSWRFAPTPGAQRLWSIGVEYSVAP